MAAGEIFGSYELLSQLGAGGMGAVYRARHTSLGREAAIKFLLPALSRNPEIVERFENEARAVAHIDHPGVAHIYEVGVDDERGAFIVMELLRGESLQERLDERGRLPVAEAVRIVRHVCSALRAAHDKGVVHRDLKPDNIFITPDPDIDVGERPKLLDFGIAKLMEPESLGGDHNWKTTVPMGTPYYMSPEQCRADPAIDGRADLYALGCILYQCVTGRVPLEGHNYLELIEAHKTRTPPPIQTYLPSCPPGLASLIEQLMAKDPADRPHDADAVYRALGSLLDGGLAVPAALDQTAPLPATDPGLADCAVDRGLAATGLRVDASIATQTAPGSSRLWPWITAGIVLVGGAAAGASLGLFGSGDEPEPAPPADARFEPTAPDAAPAPDPGWVTIPVATFTMGSGDDAVAAAVALCNKEAPPGACRASLYARETPARRVSVSGFALQEREVTNRELASWLDGLADRAIAGGAVTAEGLQLAGIAEGAGVERRGDRIAARSGLEERAAVMVSWHGARRYCSDLGGDLPTEAQWELAARGAGGWRFSWGDELPRCDAVVFGRGEAAMCPGAAAPQTAGAAAGDVTETSVRGLGGNVAEWVLDRFAPYTTCPAAGCVDPAVIDPAAEQVVIRGGAFNDFTEGLRSAGRKRAGPGELIANVGFRCARPNADGHTRR